MAWWISQRNRQSSNSGDNLNADRDAYKADRDQYHIEGNVVFEEFPDKSHSPLHGLASRFVQVFEWHGIHRAELPDFFQEADGPSISLYDLSTDDLLLRRLDTALLNFTTSLFCLHEDWLNRDNASQVFAGPRSFDKRVNALPEFLLIHSVRRQARDSLWGSTGPSPRGSLFVFATEEPDLSNFVSQDIHVGMVYRVPILQYRRRVISRYLPLGVVPWNYIRTNRELVAMWSVAAECEINVFGEYATDLESVYNICGGREFPHQIGPDDISPCDWWPGYPLLTDFVSSQDDYQRLYTPYLRFLREEDCERHVTDAKHAREEILWGSGQQ
jgi:hypothetical protein